MRLIIVANRLPITVEEKSGKISFKESAGGLATGLKAYFNATYKTKAEKEKYVWVGWPGNTISKDKQGAVEEYLLEKHQSFPVFIPEKSLDKFYLGFCNKTIWPLFHYFTSHVVTDNSYWDHYKKVNQVYCEAVSEVVKEGDTIWVHDYQLMLLPQMLRERFPNNPIGFFLHIPFPGFEIFRLLPKEWKQGILDGLLGSSLIGFHTHDYTQYFLRCVLRILGLEHKMGQLIIDQHLVKASTFPMGIDFKHFNRTAKSTIVKKKSKELFKTFENYKVILSVDRLDYTKGVLHRLRGYENFLERYPEWHGKVMMVMLVVPSRVGVDQYRQMKKKIDELVGHINGRFGRIDWTPARYQYNFADFPTLVGLYSMSDVCLVTPLRDGMNLIAKEYLASRVDQTGVLVLSEMAGAAKELQEAIIINPHVKEEIADGIQQALEMPKAQQIRRNRILQKRLQSYDVVRWAGDFLKELDVVSEDQKHFQSKYFGGIQQILLLKDYAKTSKRLILLDYDGTLSPFVSNPQDAKPSAKLLKILKLLTANRRNDVVIISGRDAKTLDKWLGHLDLSMVAEHGAYVKMRGRKWKALRAISKAWKEEVRSKIEPYVDWLPGSAIEEKACSLVWHYRSADPELGRVLEMELLDDLTHFTSNMDLQVMQGNKIVEIRMAGVNKGTGGLTFINKKRYDFIVSIGDDWTDEDLFKVLPEEAHSIRVGITQSHAKYNVKGTEQVHDLLQKFNTIDAKLKKQRLSLKANDKELEEFVTSD